MEYNDDESSGAEESDTEELMYHYDGGDVVPEHVTHVTVDPSITVILSHAFQLLVSLTTIELPDGLNTIGDMAFSDCHSLESINNLQLSQK